MNRKKKRENPYFGGLFSLVENDIPISPTRSKEKVFDSKVGLALKKWEVF